MTPATLGLPTLFPSPWEWTPYPVLSHYEAHNLATGLLLRLPCWEAHAHSAETWLEIASVAAEHREPGEFDVRLSKGEDDRPVVELVKRAWGVA